MSEAFVNMMLAYYMSAAYQEAPSEQVIQYAAEISKTAGPGHIIQPLCLNILAGPAPLRLATLESLARGMKVC